MWFSSESMRSPCFSRADATRGMKDDPVLLYKILFSWLIPNRHVTKPGSGRREQITGDFWEKWPPSRKVSSFEEESLPLPFLADVWSRRDDYNYFNHLVNSQWVKLTPREAQKKDRKEPNPCIIVDPLNQPMSKPTIPLSFPLEAIVNDLALKPAKSAICYLYLKAS